MSVSPDEVTPPAAPPVADEEFLPFSPKSRAERLRLIRRGSKGLEKERNARRVAAERRKKRA
jgi:hypothetical protein